MKETRIGLMGGTFNPIHSGHIHAARLVRERFALDRVCLMPSYSPPHKTSGDVTASEHRLKMVELAVKSYPGIEVSSIEIEAKGTSYSIFSLKKIREKLPDARIFFILGIDAFLEIETWKDYETVLTQCSFIIMSRPGYELQDAKNVLGGRCRHQMVEINESDRDKETKIRNFQIFLTPIKALNIASSDIRNKIRGGVSVSELVPADVLRYIRENQLYQ
jgi:nicotinate-nucleotide adenylyltransferase